MMQNIQRVYAQNAGPIFNRLQTKVHEILGKCMEHFSMRRRFSIVYVVFCLDDNRD